MTSDILQEQYMFLITELSLRALEPESTDIYFATQKLFYI